MKTGMKNPITVLFAVFCVIILICPASLRAADVSDTTVKILIGDETSARHHMSIAIGEVSEEYHYELKGYEAKSSSYSSSNTAYQGSKGQSWWHYQAYKTYEENSHTYVISDCILNQTDYYND